MTIDFKRDEYKDNLERWLLADNITSSRDVDQYLIALNPLDKGPENAARNKQYKERAVLYPVAGYTLQGLIGLIFNKKPVIELPPQLEYLRENVDGSGISLIQQGQDSSSNVIKKGRSGLFTTYPKTDGEVSQADISDGKIVASIKKIDAEQIIGWKTTTTGAKTYLSLVVISEQIEVTENYEIKKKEQIRELALESNIFIVREWQKNDRDEWKVIDESTPTDATGSTWDVIPFTFIGSMSNTSVVDDAPLYPLCVINKAHYRNSADYEDSVWFVGQAQPWMSGVSQAHVDMMKKNDMYVGSRTLLGVPTGESFGFASADPNPLVRQAMLDKLDMMIGLGARFVQDSGKVKTASEDNNDERSKNSGLALVSANISEAYTQALKWAARYMGADESAIEFETNQEFISPTATAQELQAMIAGFVQGAIPMGSYFKWMQKIDLVDKDKTIEEFSEEVGQAGMTDFGALSE